MGVFLCITVWSVHCTSLFGGRFSLQIKPWHTKNKHNELQVKLNELHNCNNTSLKSFIYVASVYYSVNKLQKLIVEMNSLIVERGNIINNKK